MFLQDIKHLVETTLKADISAKDRLLNNVDARKIYSKLAIDCKYSYEVIAAEMNRDHSTITHYMKYFNWYLKDKRFSDKYLACKAEFDKSSALHKKEFANYNKGFLKIEKARLERQLEKINTMLEAC